MKHIYTLLIWCMAVSGLYAQTFSNYTFSTNTTSSLNAMSGSTQLIGANQTEVASAVTNIGFDFWYMGQRFTQFSVNSHGVLRFGNVQVGARANTYNVGSSGSQQFRVVPFSAADVDGGGSNTRNFRTGASGQVHCLLSGTAPNRVLTVEWQNMSIDRGTGSPGNTASNATFQARIYETAPGGSSEDGRIELVYGTMAVSSNASGNIAFGRIGLGIQGSEDGSISNLTYGVRTSDNTAAVNTVYNNSANSGTNITNLHSTGTNARRMYRFESRSAPATGPTNLSISCISHNSVQASWTNVSGLSGRIGVAFFISTDGGNSFSFHSQFNNTSGQTSTTLTGLAASTAYVLRIHEVVEGRLSAQSSSGQASFTTISAATAYSIASGNWSDASIWSTGAVPLASQNVIIGCNGANHTVSVNVNNATCQNLTIESGSTVNISGSSRALDINGHLTINGTLDLTGTTPAVNLAGNFTSNGLFYSGSGSTFTFDGTSEQTVSIGTFITSFSGPSADINIPDNTPSGGVASANAVPSAATLTGCGTCASVSFAIPSNTYKDMRVSVRVLNGAHTDYDLYLLAPDNTVMVLGTDVGAGIGASIVYDVTFMDGESNINTAASDNPVQGNYSPEHSFFGSPLTFASFAGRTEGIWRLYVIDDQTGQTGLIDASSISFGSNDGAELSFHRVVINNSSSTGVVLSNTHMRIKNQLTLTDGYLFPGTNLVILNDGATSSGASNNSFVSGRIRKIGNDAFAFPVGKSGTLGWAGISAPAGTSDHFTVEYFRAAAPNRNLLTNPLVSVSGVEYWQIDRTAGTSSIDVWLSYENGRSGTINNAANLRVAHFKSGSWQSEGSSASTAGLSLPSGINFVRSSANISTFSPFTIGTNNLTNILPVQWQSFEAAWTGTGVRLDWSTAAAWDADYFGVERSIDGVRYHELGRVAAQNTHQVTRYSFDDWSPERPAGGTLYYRLRQVDLNGEIRYSPVRALPLDRFSGGLNIYPHPLDDQFFIEIPLPALDSVSAQLFDLQGIAVTTLEMRCVQDHKWAVKMPETIPAGMYILRIESPVGQWMQKVLRR